MRQVYRCTPDTATLHPFHTHMFQCRAFSPVPAKHEGMFGDAVCILSCSHFESGSSSAEEISFLGNLSHLGPGDLQRRIHWSIWNKEVELMFGLKGGDGDISRRTSSGIAAGGGMISRSESR